jgi:hypothetical protein
LRLSRSISFDSDDIHFRDRLETDRAVKVEEVDLPRSFTAVHMGSAKYFHSSELKAVVQTPASEMARDLNGGRASNEFTLKFRVEVEQALPAGRLQRSEEVLRKEAMTGI